MANRADQRKHHYIYKITREDGKFYVGMHSTDNLEDGYFGSGQLLWKSIKKHGKEKHMKEILEFLSSRKELSLREAALVTQELLNDPLCLNLKLGGRGDDIKQRITASDMMSAIWSDPEKRRSRVEAMKLSQIARFNNPGERAKAAKRAKESGIASRLIAGSKKWAAENPEKLALKQAAGTKGKFWITTGSVSKMAFELPDGWRKGRHARSLKC